MPACKTFLSGTAFAGHPSANLLAKRIKSFSKQKSLVARMVLTLESHKWLSLSNLELCFKMPVVRFSACWQGR